MNLELTTHIRATLRDEWGNVIDERDTTNFFTEQGEAYIADRLSDRNETDGDIDAMGVGTGSGRNRTSTTLANEVYRNTSALTPTQGTTTDDNDAIWTMTVPSGSPAAGSWLLTEGGLFSKMTTGTGTLINYFEFNPGIQKDSAQALTITVTITVGLS